MLILKKKKNFFSNEHSWNWDDVTLQLIFFSWLSITSNKM